MANNSKSCFVIIFKLSCVFLAASMTTYCIYDFSKKEDTTTVSYKIFNDDEMSIYPSFTLCVIDYSLELEFLNNKNDKIEFESIQNIYSGREWDDRMLKMERSKVIYKLEQMVIDTCVKVHHDQPKADDCKEKVSVSASVAYNGWKCFSFHYLKPEPMKSLSIWFKSSAFLYGLNTFSFPHQLININNKWMPFSIKTNSSTEFYLLDVEVYRHRNKLESPCHDWNAYDDIIMRNIFSSVGCRPFYADPMGNFRNCTNKKEIKRIHEMTESKKKFYPPCIDLRKYRSDVYIKNSNTITENSTYPGMSEKLDQAEDWFRVTVHIPEKDYKDIQQTKAYTIQSLIGNAGGYVGLFVGCAVSDLPSFSLYVYKKIINFFYSL